MAIVPGSSWCRPAALPHRGRLDSERDEIFGLEIAHVGLAASAREGLQFQRHDLEVVGEPAAPQYRVEPLLQFGVLGVDPGRVLAFVPVVVGPGGGAELLVVRFPLRVIIAQRDQRSCPDGHRVRAQRDGLGDVCAAADAAGDHQLHAVAVQAQILQRLHGGADASQRGLSDVLDEHVLRRRRAALHAVEHNHVCPSLHRQRGVEVGAGTADLDVNWHLPAGDLPQLKDLDLEVVGTGPVRVAAGRALVDALGQVAHFGNAVGDFLPQQHAAAAGLGALTHDNLDGVRAAQVVGVHAIARGQVLVDQLV